MSDGNDQQQQSEQQGDQQQGGDQQQQQGQSPEWMGALSEDLRGDATLARYASLDDFAKGHLETKRLASSKVMLPGEGADAAAMANFYDAIGRPKEAAAYDIPVPEGYGTEFADEARAKFHELGARPELAKGMAEWWNSKDQARTQQILSASQAELDAFKAETPDYDAKLAGARAMAKKLGVDEATANELDVKLGTKNLLSMFFNLAGLMGEAGRIDGDVADTGGIDVADAAGQLRTLDANKEWRDKVTAKDPDALRKRSILLRAANAQANTKKQA